MTKKEIPFRLKQASSFLVWSLRSRPLFTGRYIVGDAVINKDGRIFLLLLFAAVSYNLAKWSACQIVDCH